MLRILFLLFFTISLVFSYSSNDKYKIYKGSFYEIIFTNEYKKEAAFIKENLDEFLKKNDELFSYKMDEPLKFILVSSKNEIANAFSTQVPFNMTAFYNGGAHKLDYFNTKSWITTLLTHELIHNYQMNAKKSKISQVLHKYLGNNSMPIFASIVPFFTYPNFMLPTFIVEGNATLNEAVYNNGGRVLSGRLNALKNLLVLDGKITPKRLINDHKDFPFGEEKYIVGAFYMQYLVNEFGLKKVNSFFYENSIHSINPLRLRKSFYKHFGVGIIQTIYGFINEVTKNNIDFKRTNENILTNSKSEIYLSKKDDEIYFITTDLINQNSLNIFEINTNSISSKKDSWLNGKVFNINNKFYTDSSYSISSDEYKIGLFDENRYIKENTKSKYVQDILDGDMLYIDMKSSFSSNKLYLNEYFYDEINSSAVFDDKKNIYYFKQNNTTRQLYKNKKKIWEFESFYSKIVDVKDDKVYFIASSKYGSSLYMYENGLVKRVLEGDDIIDAKLINSDEVLITIISSKDYRVVKTKLTIIDEKPYSKTKATKKNVEFTFKETISNIDTTKEYSAFSSLEYSNTYLSLGSLSGYVESNFVDPLLLNQLSFSLYRDDELGSLQTTYINQAFRNPFLLSIYGTKRDVKYDNDRGYGAIFKTKKDFYKKGLHYLYSDFTYYADDERDDKSPMLLSFNYEYDENYPLSYFSYKKFVLNALAKEDRGELTYQFSSDFTHHIYDNSFINLNALYSKNSALDFTTIKGLGTKVTDEYQFGTDNTTVFIEGLGYEFYAKEIYSMGIELNKTFDISKYFFSFPFSLRDEILFYKYNYYDIKRYNDMNVNLHILGLQTNLLFAHKLILPITIKGIRNEFDTGNGKEVNNQLKIELGVSF